MAKGFDIWYRSSLDFTTQNSSEQYRTIMLLLFHGVSIAFFRSAIQLLSVVCYRLLDYIRLFIVATGYPSERRPQKKVSCLGRGGGNSARIQGETTDSSVWFFNVPGE